MQKAIIAALACGLVASIGGPAAAGMPEAVRAKVVRGMQKARVPGLAIAKVEGGRIVWSEAFGERAPGKPLEIDTVFNVASLSKPVFAVAALHCIGDGELALDASLEKYWVDPDVADDPRHRQLTPRILLSHQSGFPNWRSRKLGFMFDPGTRHEYSGEGYEYLRRALEHRTGKGLPALVAVNVFEPAGMNHTTLGWSDRIGDNVARGFDEDGKAIDTDLETRAPNAAAHLMSTVDDYARFAAWVAKGADLHAELFEQMRKPQALHDDPAERFGLGWKLIPLDDHEALMHDGREAGARTYAVVLPEFGEALVILTNSSNGELVFRPLVKAALSRGDAVMQSAGRLAWQYIEHAPPQALVPMSRGIARSPSFMSTLLYAVDVALIQPSALSAKKKAAAKKAIDAYVFALFHGEVKTADAEQLVARLLEKNGEALKLRTTFDEAQAQEWVAALQSARRD